MVKVQGSMYGGGVLKYYLFENFRAYIRCDLKVVFDFGDLWIHKSALLLYGKSVWWASLLGEYFSNVVILPGVTQVEVDEFILTVYGQNIVTEDKYSSDTEPFH